jgi:hypothetical protein
MRTCAKMRCADEPAATVALQYLNREVIVLDLRPEADPNLLDLCEVHVARIVPPRGWVVRDERTSVPATA